MSNITIRPIDPPAPYAFAPSRRDGTHVVHLVHKAWERVVDGTADSVGAAWVCFPAAYVLKGITFLDSRPQHLAYCPRCPPTGETEHAERVYVARLADDVVKVGTTRLLTYRMYQLGGTLIASIPGGRDVEQAVLAAMPAPIRGREWFAPGSEGLALAALKAVAA